MILVKAGAKMRRSALALIKDDSGSTLVMTMAVVTAVLLVGGALYTLGTGEADIVEYAVDSARAFYIAEAAQSRAQATLEELASQTPPEYPYEITFSDQPLGDGEYDIVVTKTVEGDDPALIEYTVVATGEVDDAVRRVRTTMVPKSIAAYTWFTDETEGWGGGGDDHGGDDGDDDDWDDDADDDDWDDDDDDDWDDDDDDDWDDDDDDDWDDDDDDGDDEEFWGENAFTTGDSLTGRVHANGRIRIDGDPWFGSKVSSSAGSFSMAYGSDPTFEGQYELGVEEIGFPSSSVVTSTLSTLAQSDGIYLGELDGSKAKYRIILGRNAVLQGYVSYRAYRRYHGRYRWSRWTNVRIANTNGVLWAEEPLELWGTLDGQLTIGSGDDVHIRRDVLYEDSTPGFGPDPGCDDVLGIVAAEDIVIDKTARNMNDCEIHAHMLALSGSLLVDRYDRGRARGDLIIWGGIAQRSNAPVATYTRLGGIRHGYARDYHWDPRLGRATPPGYPITGGYSVVSWSED